jgi:hypothetical protein
MWRCCAIVNVTLLYVPGHFTHDCFFAKNWQLFYYWLCNWWMMDDSERERKRESRETSFFIWLDWFSNRQFDKTWFFDFVKGFGDMRRKRGKAFSWQFWLALFSMMCLCARGSLLEGSVTWKVHSTYWTSMECCRWGLILDIPLRLKLDRKKSRRAKDLKNICACAGQTFAPKQKTRFL